MEILYCVFAQKDLSKLLMPSLVMLKLSVMSPAATAPLFCRILINSGFSISNKTLFSLNRSINFLICSN